VQPRARQMPRRRRSPCSRRYSKGAHTLPPSIH
jgi:hypothetical protein